MKRLFDAKALACAAMIAGFAAGVPGSAFCGEAHGNRDPSFGPARGTQEAYSWQQVNPLYCESRKASSGQVTVFLYYSATGWYSSTTPTFQAGLVAQCAGGGKTWFWSNGNTWNKMRGYPP
jgi:hypothetical protein